MSQQELKSCLLSVGVSEGRSLPMTPAQYHLLHGARLILGTLDRHTCVDVKVKCCGVSVICKLTLGMSLEHRPMRLQVFSGSPKFGDVDQHYFAILSVDSSAQRSS